MQAGEKHPCSPIHFKPHLNFNIHLNLITHLNPFTHANFNPGAPTGE